MSSEKKKLLIYGARNLSPIKILVDGLRKYGMADYSIDSLDLYFPGNKILKAGDLNFLDHVYEITESDRNDLYKYFLLAGQRVISEHYGYLFYLLIKLRFNDLKRFFKTKIKDAILSIKHKILLSKYDIVNLHFIREETARNIIKLNPKVRVVLSFWGTDLYRLKSANLGCLKYAFDRANAITMHSEEMKEIFVRKFGGYYSDKIKLVLFGNSDEVCNRIINNKSFYRKEGEYLLNKHGIDKNEYEILVKVGYSGHQAQRHEKIIEALKNLPGDWKNKTLFIFPMTYGASKEYIMRIKNMLTSEGLIHLLIEDYMTDEESIGVSVISDIMLNLRDTDAFNNSMVETLLSGNILLTGSWLPYSKLKEAKVNYFEIYDLAELIEDLEFVLENIENIKNNCRDNPPKVLKIISSKSNIPIWEKALTGH